MSKTTETTAGPQAETGTPTPEGYITKDPKATATLIEGIIIEIESVMDEFEKDVGIDTNLTSAERKRLFGVRNRKQGFIQNAWAVATENPGFSPPNFSMTDFTANMRNLELVKNLADTLAQFEQTVMDYQLLTSDACRKASGFSAWSLRYA